MYLSSHRTVPRLFEIWHNVPAIIINNINFNITYIISKTTPSGVHRGFSNGWSDKLQCYNVTCSNIIQSVLNMSSLGGVS